MTNSSETEIALLGAAILDPCSIDAIADVVTAHDFADADLGALFDSLMTLHQAGLPLTDMRVLVPELRRAGVPEAVTNAAFLGQLFTSGRAGHAQFYALEVRRASRLRSLAETGRTLASQAENTKADPDALASWLDAVVSGMGCEPNEHCRQIGEAAADLMAELKAPQAHGRVVMTGLPLVDETVGGFAPGELIVLAARTSVGKTALAMQIASSAAANMRTTWQNAVFTQSWQVPTRNVLNCCRVAD